MKTNLLEKLHLIPAPRVIFMPSALEQIEMAEFPVIFAPFHKVMVPVLLRELSEVQIRACGDFSLIETVTEPKKTPTFEEILEYSRLQYKITQAALIRPSYADLMRVVGADKSVLAAHDRVLEIERELFPLPEGPEKKEFMLEAQRLEMMSEYLLPSDFTAYVFSYAVGLAKSDIKKVSEKMLLDAAVLAEKGHDNPADHVAGNFTDFNRDEINLRAWYVLHEERKHHRG
jgi:hypothetical protein